MSVWLFSSKIIPDYHRKLRVLLGTGNIILDYHHDLRVPVGGMQEMSFKITKLKVNFRLIGCVFYFASGCICFVYIRICICTSIEFIVLWRSARIFITSERALHCTVVPDRVKHENIIPQHLFDFGNQYNVYTLFIPGWASKYPWQKVPSSLAE